MSSSYPTRGRPEDVELYPAPINPAAMYAAGFPGSSYREPAPTPQVTAAAPVPYDMGFPGGVQAYPLAQAQSAYPIAQAQPAYPMAYPTYAGQAAGVHSVSAQYGGYSGGGLPPPQVPPQQQTQRPPQRPSHQHPPNHAAGGRTHYHKPPVTQQYDVEAGGFAPEVESSFMVKAEQQMRMAFIRKVYTVLCLQLLASGLFCAYVTLDNAANEFVLTHPGLYMTGIIGSVIVMMTLMCYRNQYPVNLGLLTIFTFVEAYTIGVVTATFARAGEGEIVIQALAITFVVFLSLTIFTCQSRIDFTFLGGILFASLSVMIIWGLIGAIFGFRPGFVYSLIGAIIFSLYIVFDTYMLLNKLPYDEWVLGAISLYLDIINLFMFLLQMLAESQNREQRR